MNKEEVGRCEKRVGFDCVSELDVKARQRLSLFICRKPAL